MDRRLRFHISSEEFYKYDIVSFDYSAQRMGGAPTISFSIQVFDPINITTSSWVQFVDSEGVERSEKFFVRNAPTSSKNNNDARYKYDVVCVSERELLDNVYFIDAVPKEENSVEYVSKGIDFQFAGTVKDYVAKINAALAKSPLSGYSVVIDDTIATQDIANADKFFSCSKLTFTAALQEIYNQYDIPYYFVDKVIHVGYYNEGIDVRKISYGADDALIEVKKAANNNKIITRCSGTGSSENIPYYYPNMSPTGDHEYEIVSGVSEDNIRYVDYELISKKTNLRDGALITYHKKSPVADKAGEYSILYKPFFPPKGEKSWVQGTDYTVKGTKADSIDLLITTVQNSYQTYEGYFTFYFNTEAGVGTRIVVDTAFNKFVPTDTLEYAVEVKEFFVDDYVLACDKYTYKKDEYSFDGGTLVLTPTKTGKHSLLIKYNIELKKPFDDKYKEYKTYIGATISFSPLIELQMTDYVQFDDSDKTWPIDESGFTFYNTDSIDEGAQIRISEPINWMQPQGNLMPSIYRETAGLERFYNALNDTYKKNEEDYFHFDTEFNEHRFCEHIEAFEDIKPSIKEAVNSAGLRMDMFSEFDFDDNDNNDYNEKDELKHKFFYGKLRQLDFNLFDHAIDDGGDMTVSFTSGKCAPCNFTIAVDEKTKRNTLQVVDGKVKKDSNGNAVFSSKWQKKQNDTQFNEVWIALYKENSTYGEWMPNSMFKPEAEQDTFVLTNIRMPNEYILKAEKKLDEQILTYMEQNNVTGYNFDIKFSRIFLEQEKEYTNTLSENARLIVEYQGVEYLLYINNFSYKVKGEDALPDISVSISDSLQISKSGLSTLVSSVKNDVLAAVHNIDIMPAIARYAIRKDQDDTTLYNVTAKRLTANDGISSSKAEITEDTTIGRDLSVGGVTKLQKGFSVGNASSVLGAIKGASVSEEGDASFKSIRANYLEVMSLIYNQIKASSAYTVFDDTATVVDLTLEGNVYTLTFDETEFSVKADNGIGVQPFDTDDILVAYVNKINNYEYSQSGECWLRVTDIPSATNGLLPNQVRAIMYTDKEVPTAPNIAPNKNMVLAHKGNANDEKPERQSTIYVSSKDGNIVQLLGVNKPKLLNIDEGYSNYGAVIGKLPQDLFYHIYETYPTIKKELPYVYAKGLIVQDLMQLDYSGRLMQGENYRGHWSLGTAINEPYMNSESSYDTVTHNGSLWKCMESYTTVEPSKNTTTWLVKVSAGEIPPMYRLKPSTNVIHYRPSANTFEPDNFLSVAVGETIASGYAEITSQAILNELGLAVYYAIDGDKENKKFLNISPAAAIELEDGSGILAAQDGSGLFLEGEEIDVATIEKNITLYLVRTSDDEVIDEFAIVVSKDGQKGDKGADGAGYSLFIDTPIISQPISASSKKTIGSQDFKVNVTLNNNGEYMTTEDHTFAINASGTGLTCTYNQWEEYWEVTVSIPHDMDTTNLKRDINITVSGGGLKSAIQGKIAIAYIERGMDGSNGPLLYPAGNWDAETEYKRTYEDDELMTTPFVYHTLPDGNGGMYFVLEADYSKGNNPYDNEIDPTTKKLIWRPFQKMQYVFTEALMAKWARLAKAVFWGDYMFSSTAANKNGEKVDYSAYAESMFTNGKLNGSVVPHLFLDLESGEAKFGKLSESLIHIDHTTTHFDVVLNEGHNVSCATYNEADENYADDAITVITTPKVAEADTTVVDGTHSTVIHEYSAAFAFQPRSSELISQCVCVCSDKALFDSNPNYTEILGMGKTEDDIEAPWNGWFIWNGYRTKFIFLTPSSILKLRSCKSGENGIVWFVENSSDFEILNATMHLEYHQGDEELYTSIASKSSISLAGSYRDPIIIGSKAFNQNAAHDNNGKVEWVWSPKRYEDGGRIIYKNNNNV